MSGSLNGKHHEYGKLLKINRGETGAKAGELSEIVIEEMIRKFCMPGEMAVDCGAADGRMTRIMKGAVGDSGKVVAFEPLPEQFSLLEDEFKSSHVTVVNACVSNRLEEDVTFYHAKDCRWVSSLSPEGLEDYDVQELSVPVTTVDEVLKNLGLQGGKHRTGFIKLDIEGGEFRALQGAHAAIKDSRPIIVFENGLMRAADRFGYDKADFFGFFDDLGYSIIDIFGGDRVREAWSDKNIKKPWNFVAFDRAMYPDMEQYCYDQARASTQHAKIKGTPKFMRALRRLRRLVQKVGGAKQAG